MSLTATARRLGLERRSLSVILLLCLGHLTIDLHQGAVPALLPPLKEQLGLTYGQMGLLVTVHAITSSFVQPLIGYLSDVSRYPLLVPFGIVLAPLGMSLIGYAPTYGWIMATLVLVGIGSAAYHPEATRTTVALSGSRKGTGMALWTFGGNLGVALGPIYVGVILATGGLRGTVWSLPFGLIVGALTFAYLGRGQAEAGSIGDHLQFDRSNLPRTNWTGEALLVVIIAIRTVIQNGLVAYLPFYYTEVLGGSGAHRGLLQSILLFGGVAGTLLGGPLSDRFGPKRVLLGAFGVAVLLTPILLMATGLVAFLLLFVIGATLSSTFMLSVVLGQQYMARYASVSAGLTNGVALGIGGVGVGLLGSAADRWGIPVTAQIIAVLPLLGIGLIAMLPKPADA